MASIRKLQDRKSKPWQVRIRRKNQSFTEYFRTKKEAAEFAAKVEADFERWAKQLGGELRRHTVAELIDRYMAGWHGKDHNTPNRLLWWREHYGDRALSDFSGDTVREALGQLETEPAPHGGKRVTASDKPRTGATVNRYKAAISAVFKTAIDRGWFGVKENPVTGIRGRREQNHRFGRCLEDHERARLLAACDQSDWAGLGLFVRLALATGARRSELLKLEWSDVDVKAGSILLRDTKNGDDRRVPLIGEVRARLAERAKVRRLDDARVFPGCSSNTEPPLDRTWGTAKAEAGVDNFRIHDLRHSCGSYLARAGASAFQIAAVLGHRSGPGLTARYVHLHANECAELLEGAFGGVFDVRSND
jgi:integrase